jgi:tRNA(Ile)-lysidine synthase
VTHDADLVVELVRRQELIRPGEPVIVMLSGGRDSVCLLDVVVRLAGPEVTSALHVNYGLREAADEDERHCERLCEALRVELEIRRARRPEGAGNLQAWARDARYGAAAELALRRGAQVAAGHTASDQVETILYRLAASPGRRALLGMRPRDGRLVRPLLGVTRDQTAAYCSARGLTWREDETNNSDVYARARVRANLVPALRGVHPAAERNVIRTAQQLRDEAEVLDAVVDEVLEGRGRIELSRLAALPAALRRLVARRLAEDAAGRLAPDAAERVDELLALRDRRSAELHLADGLRALIEHGVLRFAAVSRDAEPPATMPSPEPTTAALPLLPD